MPVTDSVRFWLDECLTPSYVAGPGEAALVVGSMGLDLSGVFQADFIVASFVAGVPTGHGNGYGTSDDKPDVTVVHHIDLTPGVTYRFGPMAFVQGGGVTRTSLSCQTMVQIVRPTP